MDEIKPYLVDDNPASARELIQLARDVSPRYYHSVDRIYFTSQAAGILRDEGFTVSENPEYTGV